MGTAEAVRTFELHTEPVHTINYHPGLHACISADKSGALELWDPDTMQMPTSETRRGLRFAFKSDTHLYELRKNDTYALSISISPDCSMFMCTCEDGRLRIFRFATAKMFRAYDESL